MKSKRRGIIFALVLALVLCSAAVAMADVDYSQWDSQSSYPSDIVNTQYFAAVRALVDKGAVTGDTDGLFHPENPITRAEFSKIITIATNNTGNMATLQEKELFTDLSGYGWAKGYINCAAEAKIVEGVGGSQFAPGKNVTYAEAITMVIRTKSGAVFMAESLGTWPNGYIKYAEMYNMIGDVTVNDWNAPATRGDVAKLVYRNMPKSSADSASVAITPSENVTAPAVLLANTSAVSGTLTYQWYKDGTAIQGATGITYNATEAGRYYVSVTTAKTGYTDSTVTSATVTVKAP